MIQSVAQKLAAHADCLALSAPTLMDTIRAEEAQRIVADALALLLRRACARVRACTRALCARPRACVCMGLVHSKLQGVEVPAVSADALDAQLQRLRAEVLFELDVIVRHLPPGASQPLRCASLRVCA
jgi:hypothetical protein